MLRIKFVAIRPMKTANAADRFGENIIMHDRQVRQFTVRAAAPVWPVRAGE